MPVSIAILQVIRTQVLITDESVFFKIAMDKSKLLQQRYLALTVKGNLVSVVSVVQPQRPPAVKVRDMIFGWTDFAAGVFRPSQCVFLGTPFHSFFFFF